MRQSILIPGLICAYFSAQSALPQGDIEGRQLSDGRIVKGKFELVQQDLSVRMEVVTTCVLPNVAPTALTRRKDGLIWITTKEGLVSFDGYDVHHFYEPWDTPHSRVSNMLFHMVEDQNGTLWLGSGLGLKRYNDTTGTFVRYVHDPHDTSTISHNNITALCADERSVWVGTPRGLNRFDPAAGRVTRYQASPGLPTPFLCDSISALCRSRDGRIWVGTQSGGLSRLDPRSGEIRHFTTSSAPPFRLSDNRIVRIFEDRHSDLWISTVGCLTRFDFTLGAAEHYRTNPSDPTAPKDTLMVSLADDAHGDLWIGTASNGLMRFDIRKREFYHVRWDPTSHWARGAAPSPNAGIPSIWFSSEGNSHQESASIGWFIAGSDVWQMSISRPLFRHMVGPGMPSRESLAEGIWRMAQDSNGNIWLACNNIDVIRLDLKQGVLAKYSRGRMSGIVAPPSSGPGTCFVMTDRSGHIWINVLRGLFAYEPARDRFRPFPLPGKFFGPFFTRDGRMWVAAHASDSSRFYVLSSVDSRSGALTTYPRTPEKEEGIAAGGVLSFLEDRNGEIWFGTYGEGLYRFNPANGRYRRYASFPNATGALKTGGVSCLLEDSSAKLWVGTHSGLHSFDRRTETFVHYESTGYDMERGHFIRDMEFDDGGHIWIAMSQGVSRFTPSTGVFEDFTRTDGLELFQLSALVFDSTSRQMFVGSLFGPVSTFRPHEITRQAVSPEVVLTSFNVFEKPYPLGAPLRSVREITIPYDQNFFSFTFSALEFLRIQKIAYAHKLEGVDREWIDTRSRNYAAYTNVDPGEYIFRVKSTNTDGVWGEESASIRINILPPWWRTPWAYGLYVVLIVGILYAARTYDRKRVGLKHELEKKDFEAKKLHEIDEMKTRFFSNISHEFRTPLTLILGPVEKLRARLAGTEGEQELTMMQRNAQRLLRLVNQLLDLSRLDAGRLTLQASPTNVVALLRPLVLSFSSLADRKQITLLFDPEDDAIVAYVDRDKIEKIVINLVANALKFTPEGGEVIVGLRVRGPDGEMTDPGGQGKKKSVEIVVSDTGIGIPPEKIQRIFDRFYQIDDSHVREFEGTGIGLSLTRELVDLHKGTISLRSTPGQGSVFTVRLPMGTAHLGADEIIEHAVTPEGTITPLEVEIGLESTDEAGTAQEVQTDGVDRPRVLIVEDNADVRMYLRGYLEPLYTVENAGNGKEGLEKAFESMPDLVISDIMMPVMDGVELCKQLKTDDRTSHIPVILLTARAGGESKLEGLETGADDYIIKPFDPKELLARVKNLIELRATLREKYRSQIILEPKAVPVTSTDERFLKKLMETIEAHLSDSALATETLAHEACMSRMQLNRKLKALTGHSTHEFIRTQRLQRAARLLGSHAGNVTEVAYEVGFNNLSHFAKAFREEFGVTPSEYAGREETEGHGG